MSLTNPKKVITEERLAEFYQQILPYMGGFPDVLASKFNKSDLYSTSEQLVGRWADSKPLYQKTIDLGSDTTIATTDTIISSVDTSGYDKILSAYGTKSTGEYSQLNASPNGTGDKLALQAIGESKSVRYVTIQYTKTADSAIEIGSDNDYSTTEKIVGTWINGKSLYQKVIDFGAMPNNSTKSVSLGASGVDLVVSLRGIMYKTGYSIMIPDISDSPTFVRLFYDKNNNQIKISNNLDQSDYSAYITVQYTKTS